jgi:hypothetical protein
MIANIARILILAVDEHANIRSALGNEPETQASSTRRRVMQTTTPRKFFLQKRCMCVQARR